jgi:hypothetical protein
MSTDADMSRTDLVSQAIELDASAFQDLPMYPDTFTLDDETIIAACETFYGHGFSDEQFGAITESPFFHAYRVHRWIVTTDAPGRTFLIEEGSEDEARKRFASIVAEIEAEPTREW